MPTPSNVEAVVQRHMVQLREQLQDDLEALSARLQAVEAELGMNRRPSTASDREDTDALSASVAPNVAETNEDDKAVDKPGLSVAASHTSYEDKDPDEVTEIGLEESIWSVVMFLGLKELYIGWFDSIFAALLMLLNVAMQASFSAILFTRAFMGEEFEKKIESARTWRTSVAHDYKHQLGVQGLSW